MPKTETRYSEQWAQERRESRMLRGSGELTRRWLNQHPGATVYPFDPKAAQARADERERSAVYATKGNA